MGKTIQEYYAFAVCFVGVIFFVFALCRAIYNVIQMAFPDFTLSSYEYKNYQSNDAFWATKEGTKEDRKERPPEHELTKQREEAYIHAIKCEKRDAAQSLLQSIIGIVVNVGIFSLHWMIAGHARVS